MSKFYFYRCYNCNAWYYTNRIIKTKKCWQCNKSFTFQKSTKFTKNCSLNEAIAIIKELKKNVEDESLSKYLGACQLKNIVKK